MCDCPDFDEGSLVTDYARGDRVCMRCGVVVEGHVLDASPEWRAHDKCRAEYSPRGVKHGTPCTVFDVSVPAWALPPRDPLADAYALVDRCLHAIDMSTGSNAAAWARELYRDMHTSRAVRGEAKATYSAAAVYFGAKLAGTPRELRFIASTCGVDAAGLNDAVAAFKDRLEGRPYHARLFEAVQAGTLINMFADRLALDTADLRRIKRAAHVLDDKLLDTLDCSRAPRTICSGVMWLAAQREQVPVTKRAVAAACGVCMQSVDKMVAEIQMLL